MLLQRDGKRDERSTNARFLGVRGREPDKLCIVDPDGTEHSFGEVLDRVNQYSHGLRALGLQAGDASPPSCRTSTHDGALPGGTSDGLYFTPVNWHLVAREIAYILSDSDAKVVIGSERFAEAVQKACDDAGIPDEIAVRVREDQQASATSASSPAGQPTTRPDDLASGQAMMYTSGTTGMPKGVRRKMSDAHPDESGAAMAFFRLMSDFTPR